MPKERQAASDLLELIRDYVIQETVAPLKSLGRTLGYGVAGSLLVAIGLVIGLIGLLRVLETETDGAFGGNWSFAPYLLTAAAGLGVAGITVALGLRRGRQT
jgi:hypothetical protein